MRPVCWNIITQIVKKYARDTLIPTISLMKWLELNNSVTGVARNSTITRPTHFRLRQLSGKLKQSALRENSEHVILLRQR